MAELREAFSREHGLQCGFCTPGMLIAARDIVLRLPEADERRIRVELSGNLCRCTGYVGIVNAVRSVIEARRTGAASPATKAATPRAALAAFSPTASAAATPARAASEAFPKAEARKGWTRLEESFGLTKPPAEVWRAFADIAAVASCLPGAELTENDGRTVKGRMTVKLGPIVAAFAGSAVIEREDATMTGTIRGAGSDGGTGSRTKGEIVYRLLPEAGGARTRVDVTVEYNLQGTLAQFSRSGIVQSIGRRLVEQFAASLDARMAGRTVSSATTSGASLDAGSLLWSWLKTQLRKLFGA
jgi:carbon-monoxide dehydrogenase small subunit